MIGASKYIVGKFKNSNVKVAIIFSDMFQHREIALTVFDTTASVISAGFFTINNIDNELSVLPYGESISLEVKSNPSFDKEHIERALGLID